MHSERYARSAENCSWRAIVLAGLSGALAEVAWTASYCALTPLRGADVLREIAASMFPSIASSDVAPAVGLTLHFALGIAVSYGFCVLVWPYVRRKGSSATFAAALLALLLIWAGNFFLLLPAVNPRFVELLPYGVTLISKALFAVAMTAALNALSTAGRPSAVTNLNNRYTTNNPAFAPNVSGQESIS